jgi:hypothetical protein
MQSLSRLLRWRLALGHKERLHNMPCQNARAEVQIPTALSAADGVGWETILQGIKGVAKS